MKSLMLFLTILISGCVQSPKQHAYPIYIFEIKDGMACSNVENVKALYKELRQCRGDSLIQ